VAISPVIRQSDQPITFQAARACQGQHSARRIEELVPVTAVYDTYPVDRWTGGQVDSQNDGVMP